MAWTPREVKDMVVQYPNRFKIDGVPHTIEPDFGSVTEPGTIINREYLMPIEDKLGEIDYRVGDIVLTRRTDLPDDWLYCNGDMPNLVDYPDVEPFLVGGEPWTYDVKDYARNGYTVYGDGTWVSYHYYETTSSSSSILTYTKDLTAPWHVGIKGSSSAYQNVRVCKFINGHWLMISRYGSTDNGHRLHYGRTIDAIRHSPYVYDTSILAQIRDVAYNNGWWILVGDSGKVWFTTDLMSSPSTWDTGTIGSERLYSILADDDYTVISSSSAVFYRPGPFTPSTSGFTSVSDAGGSNHHLSRQGAYWVVGGRYALNPAGPWTATGGYMYPTLIANKWWTYTIGSNTCTIYSSDTINGTKTQAFSFYNTSSSSYTRIVHNGFGTIGVFGESNYGFTRLGGLPVIPAGDAHAYIKGR